MSDAPYTMVPNPHPSAPLSRPHQQHTLFPDSSTTSTTNTTTTIDNNNNSSIMSLDDRLDAARSLLGISPCSVADSSMATPTFGGRTKTKPSHAATITTTTLNHVSSSPYQGMVTHNSVEATASATFSRPRSNSAGLDALAFLATQRSEQEVVVEESSRSFSTRSVSTHQYPRLVPLPQETIETLDSLPSAQPVLIPHQYQQQQQHHAVISSSSDDDGSESMPPPPPRRRRSISNPEGMEKYNNNPFRLSLVLPASILEEELAEASAAIKAKEEEEAAEEEEDEEDFEEEEEMRLDHAELLRRARSRLLEDLSQGNLNGEKGVLILPHAMDKYKEVYNRNGRIGIYTPAERAAIIARFQSKRSRRVWNKKIRYNCRKSLADRRLRVKGRFVKRSTLESQIRVDQESLLSSADSTVTPTTIPATTEKSTTVTFAPETKDPNSDTNMPDVNDPDAGFCPTDEQPYRRRRRHTIT